MLKRTGVAIFVAPVAPTLPTKTGIQILNKSIAKYMPRENKKQYVQNRFDDCFGNVLAEAKNYLLEVETILENENILQIIFDVQEDNEKTIQMIRRSKVNKYYLKQTLRYKRESKKSGFACAKQGYLSVRANNNCEEWCNTLSSKATKIRKQVENLNLSLAIALHCARSYTVQQTITPTAHKDMSQGTETTNSDDESAATSDTQSATSLKRSLAYTTETKSTKKTRPSPLVTPSVPRTEKYLQREENLHKLHDDTLDNKTRARAATDLYESLNKESRKVSEKSVPEATPDAKKVRQFIQAIEREVEMEPRLEHVWYLVFRSRISSDVDGSLRQAFDGKPLSIIPFNEAKKYLLKTFGGDDNFLSVTARLAHTCTYNESTMSVAQFSILVRSARTDLLNQFGSKQISDSTMLLMFKSWLGQDTWLSREFYRLFDPVDDPSWDKICTVLDKLVSSDAVKRSSFSPAQVAAYQARKQQAQRPAITQIRTMQGTQVPNNFKGVPPPQTYEPPCSSQQPRLFCGFCKFLGTNSHNAHNTAQCPYIDLAEYNDKKAHWKAQNAQRANSKRQGVGYLPTPPPLPPPSQ